MDDKSQFPGTKAKFSREIHGPFRENLTWILDNGTIGENAKCLEIGCGEGRSLAPLARAGLQVAGIDRSAEDIAAAARWFGMCQLQGQFTVGDVTQLTHHLSPDSFDLIIDGYCLHCITGKKRHQALQEIKKVLTIGGVFGLQTACGEVKSAKPSSPFDPATRVLAAGTENERYIGNPEDIISEIQSVGLELISKQLKQRQHPHEQDLLLACFRKISA
jgi:ubiquinone/menaquinone biosynthesis C-methylase UbiE